MMQLIVTSFLPALLATVFGGMILNWYKNEKKRNETIGKIKTLFLKSIPFLPSTAFIVFQFITVDKIDKLFLFGILLNLLGIIYIMIDRLRFDLTYTSEVVAAHSKLLNAMTELEKIKQEFEKLSK